MRIIRYLSGQIVTAMLFIVVSMTCVIWLSQSLRFVDLIVNRGLPIPSFIYLTLMLMPTWLSIVLPIAAFAATLFVYNKMTNDREMVVLAAAGLRDGIWDEWDANRALFPCGIDLVLVAGSRLAALPRTTAVRTGPED